MATDTTFILAPAKATAERLIELRDRLAAVSNTEGNIKNSVEDQIRAATDGSDLVERLMATLTEQADNDVEALSIYLQIQKAVDDKYGDRFKNLMKAKVDEVKASQPDVAKPNEDEIRQLREQYSEEYTMWKAISELARISKVDLSEFGEFSAIRGPIGGGGKRIARGLFYNIDGKDLPAKQNTASNAAKTVGVSLNDFKSAFAAAAGVPEDNVGDAEKLPEKISFRVNEHDVLVTKEEDDDEDSEDETAEASE